MKKFSLFILAAALLASCGGKATSSAESSKSSEPEVSSILTSIESSESSESLESSTGPVESSEESIKSMESSEDPIESSEDPIESSEDPIESSEEPIESSEEIINDGSLEHPFTVSEGYAIAIELAPGADAGAQYFIKGVVSGTISFYKGRVSFNLADDTSSLYVYNMNNSENKASYKDGNYDFTIGDEIIVAGTFKNYVDKNNNSKLEICYVKDVADCYKAG